MPNGSGIPEGNGAGVIHERDPDDVGVGVIGAIVLYIPDNLGAHPANPMTIDADGR